MISNKMLLYRKRLMKKIVCDNCGKSIYSDTTVKDVVIVANC